MRFVPGRRGGSGTGALYRAMWPCVIAPQLPRKSNLATIQYENSTRAPNIPLRYLIGERFGILLLGCAA
jgi:hypothetical protein